MKTFSNGLNHIRTTDGEREALTELAAYPFYAAVVGRRSRRFPVGGCIPSGPLAYTSIQEPRPLTDLQRALLLATVSGQTGWSFAGDHHPDHAPLLPNHTGSAMGRTFPSTAGAHTTEFFFTDDSGTYFLSTRDDPLDVEWSPASFDRPDTVESALNAVLRRVVRLDTHRMFLPRRRPYMDSTNAWVANWPGSLLIIPVADLAQHTLLTTAHLALDGYALYDDVNSRMIPGVERFEHRLAHARNPQPVTAVEHLALAEVSAELMSAVFVGHLAMGAMGLGGWTFDGLDRLTVLGASGEPQIPGLGFHYDTDPRWPEPNPTGREGVFEALTSAHCGSVTAMVETLVQRKFGPGGPFHHDTPGPWRETLRVRSSAIPFDPEIRELLCVQVQYIQDTFGKYPATVPSVWIMNYLQAQHLDVHYYDTHLSAGAYLPTHAQEAVRWNS